MALGLLIGVAVVDFVFPNGIVPGALYVSLAMLSIASATRRLPFLASTAFMCLIALDLNTRFLLPQDIPWPILAQTSLLFVAIWVPVGASFAFRHVQEHGELMSTPLHLCPSCKKIRDDEGVWNKVDDYLREEIGRESQTAFCLDCRKRWTGGRSS